jgi:hypothetical protein
MALDAQALHDLVRDKLAAYSESSEYLNDREHPQHMAVMAATMQKYVEDNAVIAYAWSGVNPSGSSDPIKSFASTVKFTAWDLSSPMSLSGLTDKMAVAVATGTITHPAGFTLPAGSFAAKSLTLPSNTDPAQCLMKCIIEPVCAWIKTLINPAALAGSHGAFTGTATMNGIS